MKITRRNLKRLIEAFIVGPDGDVTVPTTDKQKGLGLPKSLNLQKRLASLLATGLNAVNNHNFQIYTQNYDAELLKKLSVLFNTPNEENHVMAMELSDTLGVFDEDIDTLKSVAMTAIQASPDYTTLISDITNYLPGTRSDSVFYTDLRNRSHEHDPKSYVDMMINKCLDRYFSLYTAFKNSLPIGRIKPDYTYTLSGFSSLEYLGYDYIVTGVKSATITAHDSQIRNMMNYVFDEKDISAGVDQKKLSDPRQAYMEGDDPFVVIKFTVYCDYEDSDSDDISLAMDDLKSVIDDNYSVFVTREPETYGPSNEISPGVFVPRKNTYYMLTVSGRLSEFEVTSVDEIENSWMDKQLNEAERQFSSDGFNKPCYMKINEYEEKVLYRNIRELGEVIMKVARAKNYGPDQVKSLRRLISTDQTNNDYYREELAILMATYSDMIGFTKELAADIEDETGVSLDEVINPEDYR